MAPFVHDATICSVDELYGSPLGSVTPPCRSTTVWSPSMTARPAPTSPRVRKFSSNTSATRSKPRATVPVMLMLGSSQLPPGSVPEHRWQVRRLGGEVRIALLQECGHALLAVADAGPPHGEAVDLVRLDRVFLSAVAVDHLASQCEADRRLVLRVPIGQGVGRWQEVLRR